MQENWYKKKMRGWDNHPIRQKIGLHCYNNGL